MFELEILICQKVIGVAHAIIGRVLLMCYNPTLPRIGPGHKRASQEMEVSP
jgi:hypothetical protein